MIKSGRFVLELSFPILLVSIETDIEPNEKDHFLNDLDIQFVNNRYSVKLLWLENVVSTSDNYDLCHHRLDSLFSRLKRDPKLMPGGRLF